ncbi:solute:sodium symporter family transporter [Ferrimonas lipolytica]|uniref:Solute:sodium symporter family transporter n=1 Tax=Ferrimonas lipolytica TaxID=2724191 RepID=A0A6H1UEM2_9GAMM|nr:solute:sodium symporter family transporter [Ferrimonas lipolytica]QIZ77494.1 solute:sodium symporter family transporter [Ferrimonas lipolytica]
MTETLFVLASFLAFMLIVALYSYSKTKGISESGVSGFFLAGRGLTAWFIVGSLLLSNLSAEQLVGLNGNAYRFDISGLAWESSAAIATIAMALFFLPRYLKRGITTMPEFLEERFDATTRRMVSIMFLIGYAIMANPSSLYLGAITMDEMFGLHESLDISYSSSIAILSLVMGAVGGLYAACGGLKAVAVSDTINGIILLVASILIPFLGLMALGDGSISDGFMMLVNENPEQLNAIGDENASVPFGTLFTGMICANLFYWCTNQMIIQRTLGAKSLAEGQKGVLLAGSIKLLVPLVMVLPGLIAFNMFGDTLENGDVAYPTLVKAVLPWWLTGLFAAALFGTVVSHFNSIVNSSATLFAMDLYGPLTGCTDEKKLVKVGKWGSVAFALVSIAIAPLLLDAPGGIFDLLRRFTGFYNIPIITIVLVGFLTKRVPAVAAKFVLGFHIVFYGSYMFAGLDEMIDLHYIHIMGIMFALEVGIMMLFGKLMPKTDYQPKEIKPVIPMQPWHHAKSMSVFIVAGLVTIYVTLSPLGLANPDGIANTYPMLVAGIWMIAVVIIRQLRKSVTGNACASTN